jgi:hypothetical protein
MDNFSLFCKSYRNDVLRARELAKSVQKFNRDGLAFYISVPAADIELFHEKLDGLTYILLKDEEILQANPRHSIALMQEMPGGLLQQVVKSEFWRLELCRNYLMLDSDAYFIRPFTLDDFMFDEETPYTVMHEGKDILDFAARRGMKKIKDNYTKDRIQGKKYFNRQGRIYNFGPIPTICSALVWKALSEKYAEPNKNSFADLIREYPNEMLWYGEALLQYTPIRLMPIEPLFKVFHYKEQFKESQGLGETEETIAENYLGIIKQSNWDYSLDLIPRKKRSWKTFWLKM